MSPSSPQAGINPVVPRRLGVAVPGNLPVPALSFAARFITLAALREATDPLSKTCKDKLFAKDQRHTEATPISLRGALTREARP